jgi:hypothetical protein
MGTHGMTNPVQIKRNYTEMTPEQVEELVSIVARIFLNHVIVQNGARQLSERPDHGHSKAQLPPAEQRTA